MKKVYVIGVGVTAAAGAALAVIGLRGRPRAASVGGRTLRLGALDSQERLTVTVVADDADQHVTLRLPVRAPGGDA